MSRMKQYHENMIENSYEDSLDEIFSEQEQKIINTKEELKKAITHIKYLENIISRVGAMLNVNWTLKSIVDSSKRFDCSLAKKLTDE